MFYGKVSIIIVEFGRFPVDYDIIDFKICALSIGYDRRQCSYCENCSEADIFWGVPFFDVDGSFCHGKEHENRQSGRNSPTEIDPSCQSEKWRCASYGKKCPKEVAVFDTSPDKGDINCNAGHNEQYASFGHENKGVGVVNLSQIYFRTHRTAHIERGDEHAY